MDQWKWSLRDMYPTDEDWQADIDACQKTQRRFVGPPWAFG